MTRAGVSYSEPGTALALCPVFGYLVDRVHTRKFPFLSALVILAGCMVIQHTSHSLAIFIVGRLLQGCAAALVVVVSFALLNDSVPMEHLGQTIGYLGSAIALGFLLGPFLGGIVFHAGGYNAVFYVAYSIIAVDCAMRVAMIEKRAATQWEQESVTEQDSEPNGNVPRPGAESASTEQNQENRQTPSQDTKFALFRILQQRRVLLSSWALLVQGILVSAFDATLPIFVETRYGWSEIGMGLIFLPMAIPAFLEPLFGFITDRCGARLIACGCFCLLCPALICLRFAEQDDLPYMALLIILLFLIGVFIHACTPAMFVETQRALSAMEAENPGCLGPTGAVAQGFGLQSMCQFAGVFFGPLWGGFVEYRFGWGAMSGSLGMLAALTAVPMLWLSSDEHEEDDEDREPLFRC
ncbi:Major facilitator superfamily domain general substrate transporter [Penicillium malachiteum]|uniref:Major facilitator superfamily domain general substrate transporter n=1 Tax=Penicillium malachiteum TaxID=1324776 RepID=UPI00254979A7|nr:Major facilitator superfamily domain general substrate transporter [Penicillium malachiteum]KAJ5728844.1 Major facilitator superfamily domain general substrate transporter [Penicillium malachiteum]